MEKQYCDKCGKCMTTEDGTTFSGMNINQNLNPTALVTESGLLDESDVSILMARLIRHHRRIQEIV